MKLRKRERIDEGSRVVAIVRDLRASGMSLKDACDEVGIDKNMYYFLTR